MKREIRLLQKEKVVIPTSRYQLRVLRGLKEKGIATSKLVNGEVVFRLVPAWKEVSFTKKLPRKIHLSAPEILQTKEIETPVKQRPGRPAKEKDPIPDPPKLKIVRPPAVYSNPSYHDRINAILNTKK